MSNDESLQNMPELLTLSQASEVLSCHPNTLRLWDKKNILSAVRFGARGDRRYKKSDILAFIERNSSGKHENQHKDHANYNGNISINTNKRVTDIGHDLTISSIHPSKQDSHLNIPLFTSTVPAGFPSPADDFIDSTLDLNEMIIQHPSATFFVKARGESMINSGINSGDILVVDRSIEPQNNTIIIAILDGELTVKQMKKKGEKLFLMPSNPHYQPIQITSEVDFEVWGTVTHVIHKTK